MKVVFIGAIQFSYHCLDVMLQAGAEIVGVVTLTPAAASGNSDYRDLEPLVASRGIPFLRVARVGSPDAVSAISVMQPDVICVFGFSQLLPKALLDIPPQGCIGSHPALLPRNRGRHPLIWALVEGLTESGLTFFYLDEGADSGDILWQRSFPIVLEDDAGTLYRKVEELATEGIHEFLPELQSGTAVRTPQDHQRASYWRKRGEADGQIDWSVSSLQIYNLVRALTEPYVGAHTWHRGARVIVWRARPPAMPSKRKESPGTVVETTDAVIRVSTGDGVIDLARIESADGTRVRLLSGDTLGT